MASSIGDNAGKTSWSGVIFEGSAGQIYGSPALATNAEIPSGKTLTIPEGSRLTINPGVTLTNNGTITNSGEIVNNGNLDNKNTITNSGSGSYSGAGTVDKSTPAVTPPAPKTGLTYNGSAQALINAGRASAGTLQYSTDGTSYSTDIPAGVSAGDYTVYYKVEGNAYYNDVAERSVSVSIAKAAPTVSAAVSLSGSAGAREAALTVTVTGVANGAAPTGTVTLTGIGLSESLTLNNGTASYIWTGLANNNYAITAAYSGDSSYDTASIEKTFCASKQEQAALTILDVGNKTYGDPAFTLSTSGGSGSGAVTFESSDPTVISISGTTAAIHKAGNVTITAAKAEDEDYNASFSTLSVTVEKRAVVFQANDQTVQQGGTMPAFDYAPVTLAQGDSITTEPAAVCAAADTNTVGTFPITLSGAVLTNGDNYEISYQPGTLTVTARPAIDGGSGGSYTPPAYPPAVEQPGEGGGAPTVSPSSPKRGDTVTVTPKPDTGYEVDQIIVTDQNGKPVAVMAKPDGACTFTQPTGKVKIEVTYKPVQPVETPWSAPFTDVAGGEWYYDAVRFVSENGLMDGYGGGLFRPNDTLSRAQLAQILFNKEDRPAVNYLMQYGDVTETAWYGEAVRWVTSQGIVGGYGNGMFGPNDDITREQLAVMLWRYTNEPVAAKTELDFADTDKISDYALAALRWAVEQGIVQGKDNGILDPKGNATRAEVAAMLTRYLGE